jgi:hypothetical protein
MCYDTLLFIDIIESVEGIRFLGQVTTDGITVNKYQGLNGRSVFIDLSEDEITPQVGVVHLIKLGIPYLIKSLFPEMASQYAELVEREERR